MDGQYRCYSIFYEYECVYSPERKTNNHNPEIFTKKNVSTFF